MADNRRKWANIVHRGIAPDWFAEQARQDGINPDGTPTPRGEMRGTGPGESRDPMAGYGDTVESRLARGVYDGTPLGLPEFAHGVGEAGRHAYDDGRLPSLTNPDGTTNTDAAMLGMALIPGFRGKFKDFFGKAAPEPQGPKWPERGFKDGEVTLSPEEYASLRQSSKEKADARAKFDATDQGKAWNSPEWAAKAREKPDLSPEDFSKFYDGEWAQIKADQAFKSDPLGPIKRGVEERMALRQQRAQEAEAQSRIGSALQQTSKTNDLVGRSMPDMSAPSSDYRRLLAEKVAGGSLPPSVEEANALHKAMKGSEATDPLNPDKLPDASRGQPLPRDPTQIRPAPLDQHLDALPGAEAHPAGLEPTHPTTTDSSPESSLGGSPLPVAMPNASARPIRKPKDGAYTAAHSKSSRDAIGTLTEMRRDAFSPNETLSDLIPAEALQSKYAQEGLPPVNDTILAKKLKNSSDAFDAERLDGSDFKKTSTLDRLIGGNKLALPFAAGMASSPDETEAGPMSGKTDRRLAYARAVMAANGQ